MGRWQWQPSPKRSIRMPLRLVERVYGRGNFDDAGEAIVDALREVSDWPDQYRGCFEFDSTHPNPWYHTMIFEVEGMPDSVFERFVELVAEHGLIEPDAK